MVAGDLDGNDSTDLVTLRSDEFFSVVTVHAPFGVEQAWVGLIGAYQAAAPTRIGSSPRAMLVQSGVELEFLFADPVEWTWCRGLLDELPPVGRFASGDFDGDGEDELAVIDVDGVASLWSSG